MKFKLPLMGIALVVLLTGILVRFPAYQAYRLLDLPTHRLELSGFSGTVWNGRIDRVGVDGMELGRLTWQLNALAIPLGKLSGELTLEGREVNGSAHWVRGIAKGGIILEQVSLVSPAHWLQVILQEPFFDLAGQLVLKLDRVIIDSAGWLMALDGDAIWAGAAVSGTLRTEVGDLTCAFHTDSDGTMVGKLGDSGGPLALGGQVVIQNRQYRVEALLKARTENVPLRQALQVVGPADRQGRTMLNITGPMLPIAGAGS